LSYPRIMPVLLLDEDGLVKTTAFGERRYIGDPINAVRIFNEKEVDELVILDINASVRKQAPRFALIEKIAAECRMPLTYGGGIKSFAEAERIITMGVEKISLSSQAFHDLDLVRNIATSFGNQSTAVCIDYKRGWMGKRQILTHNGTQTISRKMDACIEDFIAAGVGEIIFNSIADDGAMTGFDIGFATDVSQRYDVPMTFIGGAGTTDHIQKLFQACGNVGAGVGSMFVYKGRLKGILINYPDRAEKDRIIAVS
jgi:imidazole glycerol-phosphate synthase subunit HisF